ncbi:hypothetical protein [Microbacterium sp. Root553]|uniref:hypothetical protein n=1 Tax=Microbacterium sp. Root553 TaxID=1736556 RepID=UPI0012FB1850|nr:hypothetical protein [Microbacterium sp. Root553]
MNSDENTLNADGGGPPAEVSELYTMFRREEERKRSRYREYVQRDEYLTDLHQAFASFYEKDAEPLAPGDIVQWKTFMRNRPYPAYLSPAIVMELAPSTPPANDLDDDVEDVIIGYLDGDQDLRLVRTDARRLTLWED